MIYTIGHEANYLATLAEHPTMRKVGRRPPGTYDEYPDGYPGGYAFRTAADAQRRIDEAYPTAGFAVFGIDADWEMDTVPAVDGWWHSLVNDARVIVLDDTATTPTQD